MVSVPLVVCLSQATSPLPGHAERPPSPSAVPAVVPWLLVLGLLVVGLPLFVCMPLWVDVTQYDLCARNLLWGGVAYRDAFDTNLPGMVWLHAGIRALLGWRSEVIRLVDVVFVGSIIALLLAWLRGTGRSWAACGWAALAFVAYYLATTEISHCQRDTWMLLPALAAVALRRRQLARWTAGSGSARGTAVRSLAEGVLWGAAFWIKPFVAVPALVCWLLSVVLARRGGGLPLLVAVDAAGVLAGGLAAAVPGVVWLWELGAWPSFREVMLDWNPEYRTWVAGLSRYARIREWAVGCFPWCLVPVAAVPPAVGALWRGVVRPQTPTGDRALLAGLYLGWLGQAVFLQFPHEYVLAPVVLLGMAVLAAEVRPQREAVPAGLLAYAALLLLAACAVVAVLRHPLARPARLALWPRCCWQEGSTARARDALALVPANTRATSGRVVWEDLERVATFLRERNVGDGELLCFHDATHPLYLDLRVRPASRFFQFFVVLAVYHKHREEVRRELEEAPVRYIVSDLRWVGVPLDRLGGPAQGEVSALPLGFPEGRASLYPWCEPVVFRSGRYLVHKARGPVPPFWTESPKE